MASPLVLDPNAPITGVSGAREVREESVPRGQVAVPQCSRSCGASGRTTACAGAPLSTVIQPVTPVKHTAAAAGSLHCACKLHVTQWAWGHRGRRRCCPSVWQWGR